MLTSLQAPSFAFSFNIVLLLLVVAGFGARALLFPEYWPPVRASLISHILVTGGWFILVVYQASLVGRRKIACHMRLGQLGIVMAILVVVTGITMIVELNARQFSWLQIASNAVNLITFAILFSGAMIWRKDRMVHMRLVTFASLALMTPAIARLLQPLGLEAFTHPVWLALCTVLVIYDWHERRAVTVPTKFGVGVSVAGLVGFAVVAVLLAGSAKAQAQAPVLTAAQGYEGRIRLVRFLDEPDGYCVDVPGGGDRVMLNMPAIAHTCHFDALPDQVFRFNTNGRGQIVWNQGEQDVCLSANAPEPAAGLKFERCQETALQAFDATANGEIRLRGASLCLAVERTAPPLGQPMKHGQDSYGRGRPVNPQFTHLARALQLARCGEGDPSMQRWMAIHD